jgi:galactokinase
MVGGGFGGIVLAVVEPDQACAVGSLVVQRYYEARGLPKRPFSVCPSAGASVMDLG